MENIMKNIFEIKILKLTLRDFFYFFKANIQLTQYQLFIYNIKK
jgi:hypothetical protein